MVVWGKWHAMLKTGQTLHEESLQMQYLFWKALLGGVCSVMRAETLIRG
jgi:hypothetical protein